MKRVKFFCFALLLFSFSGFKLAQAQQIRLNLDWAVFQSDSDHAFLEIYYSLIQNQINYAAENENLVGMTLGHFLAFRNDSLVIDHAWKNKNAIQHAAIIDDSKEIIDRVGFKMKSSEYRCKFILQDLKNLENSDSLTWMLTMKPSERSTPYFSDIQIASSITQEPDAKNSPFYKNTLVVVPHPNLIFGKIKPVLFFYAEAYNLDQAALPEGYFLKYYITNACGDIIENIVPRKVRKERVVNPSVEFGMLRVGSVANGSYEFHVEISDLQDESIIHQRKKFYVYQPDEAIAGDLLRQGPVNFFLMLDSAQVEDEFLKISYLINKSTKDTRSEIDNLAGKKNFLHQFWSMYAPDRLIQDNEFRKEYLNRVEYTNDAFRAFRRDGWKTDRGRVYMVYGPPSDIERHPNEPNAYPYEIWHYNEMQGGVIFVFADFDGYRDLRLLHSTLVGEVRNYNFMNLIRK